MAFTYEDYEQTVKQQLYESMESYTEPDGTVAIDGWLNEAAYHFELDEPRPEWREWAEEVMAAR